MWKDEFRSFSRCTQFRVCSCQPGGDPADHGQEEPASGISRHEKSSACSLYSRDSDEEDDDRKHDRVEVDPVHVRCASVGTWRIINRRRVVQGSSSTRFRSPLEETHPCEKSDVLRVVCAEEAVCGVVLVHPIPLR